uniref:CUB domain-containing protein n=1 Tax=Strongyloides venezuelensis TaxID=75913 RepID=A0A0K0FFM2_STRVS
MIYKYKTTFFIIFINVFLINDIKCQKNDTNILSCNSDKPKILIGENKKNIFKIPFEGKEYLSSQNCTFIIRSTPNKNRSKILLTVDYMDIEEPLFSECSDYLAIYSGEERIGRKLINKICGTINYPFQITSDDNSILLEFISDNLVQRRGFQISYERFEVPGCPSDWIVTNDGKSCLYIYDNASHSLTWIDAQLLCEMSFSNLVTFDDYNEYQLISETINIPNATLWMGYQDFIRENDIMSTSNSQNISTWNVPNILNDRSKNCLTLTITNSSVHNFNMVDCRNKHSFVCKRSYDYPYTMRYRRYRKYFDQLNLSNTNWLFYIFITLTILFLLVILYCLLTYCTKHKRNVQINNYDQNTMLVQENKSQEHSKVSNNVMKNNERQYVSQTKVKKIKKSIEKVDVGESVYGSAKFEMKANQPNFMTSTSRLQTPNLNNCENSDNPTSLIKPSNGDTLTTNSINLPNSMPTSENDLESTFIDNEKDSISSKANLLDINSNKMNGSIKDEKIDLTRSEAQNKNDNSTTVKQVAAIIEENNDPGLSLVLEYKKKHFDRPQILKISNASAISLDEFWNNT